MGPRAVPNVVREGLQEELEAPREWGFRPADGDRRPKLFFSYFNYLKIFKPFFLFILEKLLKLFNRYINQRSTNLCPHLKRIKRLVNPRKPFKPEIQSSIRNHKLEKPRKRLKNNRNRFERQAVEYQIANHSLKTSSKFTESTVLATGGKHFS